MAATAGHRLTLDPMGKYSNAFFSETTNQTESKLDRNVHWMVFYKVKVFCSDIKWKMAAMAGLNLTLEPMGTVSQNASSPIGVKKTKFCRGPSNDHSWAVWFKLSKWFQRGSVLRHCSHRLQC
jgi:hypothetical protein